MSIKKQEYYEGAAIHRLICYADLKSISFQKPFYVLNDELCIYLKYCTKKRSPWGFTFMPHECRQLQKEIEKNRVVCGLVCGFDGIVTVDVKDLLKVGLSSNSAVRIAVFRKHGEYYRISGPACDLDKLIPPSEWIKILQNNASFSEKS